MFQCLKLIGCAKVLGRKWAGRGGVWSLMRSLMQALEACQRSEPLSLVSSLDVTHCTEKCGVPRFSTCFYLNNLNNSHLFTNNLYIYHLKPRLTNAVKVMFISSL